MRRRWKLAALLVTAAALSACGLSGVRRSQDWSSAGDDPRLTLACHVGNYGSGVLLSCDEAGARVLTCAHLVDAGESVTVHFHDPATGNWVAYDGEVVRRTHPHREDLAEIRLATLSFHLPRQTTPLAAAMPAGEECEAALVNIAFGAEERPFLLTVPAVSHVASIDSVIPDADGSTSWQIPKVLVHGGVTQANSGSPVFRGAELVGLVESAPAFASKQDGTLRIGVQATAPQSVLEFVTPSR